MLSDRSYLIALFIGLLLLVQACKSDSMLEEPPTETPTGLFYATGTLTPLAPGLDTVQFAYRSGEEDPWGNTVVASTYQDYVNFAPYKSLIGELRQPAIPIFSIGVQSLNEIAANQLEWTWTEPEVSDLLVPGDTLSIGYGPGQAILGINHPVFQYPTGPLYTLPEENEQGFSPLGKGRIIIRSVEPYSATAYEVTRAGLRVKAAFRGRLNGVLGQPDYWAEGEAVLFYEY